MNTLQECFEEGGWKFPFTVKWCDKILAPEGKIVVITTHVFDGTGERWIPATAVGHPAIDTIVKGEIHPCGFYGLALEKSFELVRSPELDRREALAEHIYEIIKHGDYDHKKWLRLKSYEVAEAWFQKEAK